MQLIEEYNKHNKFGQENNLRLKILKPGKIEYRMTLKDAHFALPDVIHGGAIAGFMDAIVSVAAFSSVADENKHVATVEFKINFLKAVRRKMELLGIGKVIQKGNKIIVVLGEIYNDDNQLVATGIGSIMPYPAST